MENIEFNPHLANTKKGISKMLKVCPVCETLNSAEQDECFICSWHGKFVEDEGTINDALDELILRCPSFCDTKVSTRISLRDRLRLMVHRLKGHQSIDTTA